MNCRVFVDTASDISIKEAKEMGLELITLPVTFNGEVFEQGEDDDFSRFYEKMAQEDALPSTSQPAFGDLLSLFKEIKEAGQEAVYLTISIGISGTYESAIKALDMVDYDKIFVVNSNKALSAQAMLALHMGRLAKKGLSAAEIAQEMEDMKKRALVCENVTELNHLKKGGRIPGNLALLGSLFHITPFLLINDEGILESPVKDRGLKNSIKRIIRFVERYELDPDFPICVQYSSDKEEARGLYEYFQEKFGPDRVKYHAVGPVVGTHLGPNTVGAGVILSKAGNEKRMAEMLTDPKCYFK